jgi:hypothetical protein
VIAATLAVGGCGGNGGPDGMRAARTDLLDRTGDSVVVQWNLIAVQTIGTTPPFPSTRAMAAVQGAVFEAVNSITGEYEPYFPTTRPAPAGANPEAAAVAAAHGVLTYAAIIGGAAQAH